MGKISDRHIARVEKSHSDWKESRLVIAALSVAGTATFMGSVVLPLTTSTLTAKLDYLAPAEEKIAKLEKELTEVKQRMSSAEAAAAQAIAKTPFLPGSVYPVGLDKVLIGSTREHLIESYPQGVWDEDGDYYSVETGHPHFSSVAYYFTSSQKRQNVTMILFVLDHDSPLRNGAIRERFSVLFGAPDASGRKGRVWWKATPRESIEIEENSNYLVRDSKVKPMWAIK